jgi:ParB family chromosome partitioning protein
MESLADDLTRHLGSRVQITWRGNRGKLEIEFYSNEDLDRLIARLQTS